MKSYEANLTFSIKKMLRTNKEGVVEIEAESFDDAVKQAKAIIKYGSAELDDIAMGLLGTSSNYDVQLESVFETFQL